MNLPPKGGSHEVGRGGSHKIPIHEIPIPVASAFRRKSDTRGLILLYHRIESTPSDPFDLSVPPELFAQHLEVIAEGGSIVDLVNHLMLTAQPDEVRRQEMTECRRALEALTNRPVTLFAYPYGAVDEPTARAAREQFDFAVDCTPATVALSFDVARVSFLP